MIISLFQTLSNEYHDISPIFSPEICLCQNIYCPIHVKYHVYSCSCPFFVGKQEIFKVFFWSNKKVPGYVVKLSKFIIITEKCLTMSFFEISPNFQSMINQNDKWLWIKLHLSLIVGWVLWFVKLFAKPTED